MVFLFIFVGLSGCNNPDTDIDNGELPDILDVDPLLILDIQESTIKNNIKFTFERAYIALRFHDDFKIFTIEINGTNIENIDIKGSFTAFIYKMEDGTNYNASFSTNSTAIFTLSPR